MFQVKTRNWLKSKGRPSLGSVRTVRYCGTFFSPVLDFVEHEEGDDALAFGVLRDVERNVEIDHAGKNPAYAGVAIADQPPVFDDGVRGGFFVLAFVLTFPAGLFAWLVARFFGGLFGGRFSVALARDGGRLSRACRLFPV